MSLIEAAIISEIKLRRQYHATLSLASVCKDLIIHALQEGKTLGVRGFHTILRYTVIRFADWYDNKYKNEEPLCTGNLFCTKTKWHLCRDTDCKRFDSDGNHERHTCEYWTPSIISYAKEVSKA